MDYFDYNKYSDETYYVLYHRFVSKFNKDIGFETISNV